ncbi:MAG: CRISPR-associated endonuclease Cas2 [Gallionella sp.]|nr:CRISPR-associated endonuclease Cas2 [Gallionella sp.]
MSQRTEFTLIAFDVAEDKRRRKLIRVLESFGVRAQESVFEAWLTGSEQDKLMYEAGKHIIYETDRFAVYVLASTDFCDIVSLGVGKVTEDFTHGLF